MNKVKHAIFFDLDDTLLSTVNSISDATKTMAEKLNSKNHELFISTGRQFYSAIPFHQDLNFKTPLITLNGATIYNPDGTLLFAEYLDKAFIDHIHTNKYAKKYFKIMDFETPNKSIVKDDGLSTFTFLHTQMPQGLMPNVEELTENNIEETYNACNAYIFFDLEHYDDVIEHLPEIFTPTVSYRLHIDTSHQAGFLEIFPSTVNKATGIAFVKKHLGIEDYRTMAFGDGTNDVEMLSNVHHGVAMVNGTKEAQSVSDEITTKSNIDSGVAHYLKEYFGSE